MNTVIIACRTLEKELLAAMARTGCTYPVRWLSAGNHNVPDKRRAEIQQILDECAPFETALLAMSLCGNAVTGLQSRHLQLVVPKCDDCITLLLGSKERRSENPATYFLTEGWLAGEQSIWQEYQHAVEKHGQLRAKRIFGAMLNHYEKLAFVDTGCGDSSDEIRMIAQTLNLEYTRISGTLSYLEDLLTAKWDDRFLIIPPEVHTLTVLPENIRISVSHGANLMKALQHSELAPDAPCGGNGTCGKCRVFVGDQEVLACHTAVTRDMVVTVPRNAPLAIAQDDTESKHKPNPHKAGYQLALDIGTTSLVCYLLDGNSGTQLASAGAANPQAVFGADVISRIQAALQGQLPQLTALIRESVTNLIQEVCQTAAISPSKIGTISMVGNPAMQQLFLGILPDNLASIPFTPVLTQAKTVPCGDYLSLCSRADLLIVPDISGYIGADTLGCVLSTKLYESKAITLMVDIGTNGELVLGNRERMIACATAAGPALEGASIRFGMYAAPGAIDHVRVENGKICCSVIGGGKATGICGSGLVDAVSAALELGLLNKRGRIQNEERIIPLRDDIYLTQEDIRQFQMAKGAIHAGILLLAKQLHISLADISQVLLAGAFGTHINPHSACRTGLLPEELEGKIIPVGNAAGAGAKMLAQDSHLLNTAQQLRDHIVFLELASLPEFSGTFARSMGFQE